MFFRLFIIHFFVLATGSAIVAQGNFTWFNPNESQTIEKMSSLFSDCYVEKEELNKALGKEIIEFDQAPFFVYNHPQIRKYKLDEFLIESEAYVSKVGDNHFLIIKYIINSEKAKSNYGNLEQGGKIKVTLINSDHLYLENIERDRGKVKHKANKTVYTGTYAIDNEDLKKLKKTSIDKITVLWEEGVEDYYIQNIDLVKQQLNCLD